MKRQNILYSIVTAAALTFFATPGMAQDPAKTATNHDQTANIASAVTPPPAQATIGEQMQRNGQHHATAKRSKARSLEECLDCPKPLKPATSQLYGADGKPIGGKTIHALDPQSKFKKLNPDEDCDKYTPSIDWCFEPDQGGVVTQLLTPAQLKDVKEGRATYRVQIRVSKSFAPDTRKAIAEVWQGLKPDYDKIAMRSDRLPKNKEGQPYAPAEIIPILDYGKVECAYVIPAVAALCPPEEPEPPVFEAPKPYCGDGILQPERGEQCEPALGAPEGKECRPDCTLYELPKQPAPPAPFCGDGVINQSWERCDDGNKTNGDGCSSSCQPEQTIVVTPTPEKKRSENRFFLAPIYDVSRLNILTKMQLSQGVCPGVCNEAEIQQNFEGTSKGIIAAYERPDITAEAMLSTATMEDKQQEFGSHQLLKPFFATNIQQDTAQLDVKYSPLKIGAIGIGAHGEGAYSQVEISTPAAVGETTLQEANLGVMANVGPLNGTHVGASIGWQEGETMSNYLRPGFQPTATSTLPVAFSTSTMTGAIWGQYSRRNFDLKLGVRGYADAESDAGSVTDRWDVKAQARALFDVGDLNLGIVNLRDVQLGPIIGGTYTTMSVTPNDRLPRTMEIEGAKGFIGLGIRW